LELGAHNGEVSIIIRIDTSLGVQGAVHDVAEDQVLVQLVEQSFHGGRKHWVGRRESRRAASETLGAAMPSVTKS
jgi:hypothetical protein